MLTDVAIVGTARVVPMVLAALQSIVAARLLGPQAFGAVALIAAYPLLVFGLLSVRTTETTTRFLAAFDVAGGPARALGLCKLAYAVDLAIASLALAIVILTAGWAAPLFLDQAALAPLMTVYALALPLHALRPTSTSILVVTGRFALAGSLEVGGAALRFACVVGLLVLGHGVAGMILGTVIAGVLADLATALVAHRVGARRWGRSWTAGRWADLAGHRREIGRFFLISDVSELVAVATRSLDVLLLGYFRPTAEIGYYNLAKSLAGSLSAVVMSVRAVALPDIVRLWTRGAWAGLWAYVGTHTRTIGLPAVAGLGLLMLFLDPAIRLVYGAAFAPAAPVARVLLLQVVLLVASLWIGLVPVAWGDVHVRLAARVAGAVLALATVVALASSWGIMAGAMGIVLHQAVVVAVLVSWVVAQRQRRALEAQARRGREG